MGTRLVGRGRCKCTVHKSLRKRLPEKANGHTLHNLMRVNREMYNEVEAAMHRFVPVLVLLKGPGPADREDGSSYSKPHDLKRTSSILTSLNRTQHIILQSALSYSIQDAQEDTREFLGFFDWWQARSKSGAQLKVHFGEFTYKASFGALEKLDYWLSEQPRNLGDMRFVFDGIEDCERSIRTCVITYEESVPGRFQGPRLGDGCLKSLRWFCRRHPDLIESRTDWANVEEKEKDTDGFEKIVTIYPWT